MWSKVCKLLAIVVILNSIPLHALAQQEVQTVSAQTSTAILNDLEGRVKSLESKVKPKMISPVKEIDFLFEDVFGNEYVYLSDKDKTTEPVIIDNRKIRKIKVENDFNILGIFTGKFLPSYTEIEFMQEPPFVQEIKGILLSSIPSGTCNKNDNLLSRLTSSIVLSTTGNLNIEGKLSSKVTSVSGRQIKSKVTGTISINIPSMISGTYDINGNLFTQATASCDKDKVDVESMAGSMKLKSKTGGFKIEGNLMSSPSRSEDQVITAWTGTLSFPTERTYANKDLVDIPLEAKLQAIEKTLNLKPDKNDDMIKRIDRIHTKLNDTEWQTDNLRFGIAPLYLNRVDAMAMSVALHAYFSYRRYMPASTFPQDWVRRSSFFVAVGAGSGASSSASFESPVYTVGLGIDIVKGVAITAGYSIFNFKTNDLAEIERRKSYTFGITLNSDLWRDLFGITK